MTKKVNIFVLDRYLQASNLMWLSIIKENRYHLKWDHLCKVLFKIKLDVTSNQNLWTKCIVWFQQISKASKTRFTEIKRVSFGTIWNKTIWTSFYSSIKKSYESIVMDFCFKVSKGNLCISIMFFLCIMSVFIFH